MRTCMTAAILMLATVTARAQQPSTPLAQDTLSWISGHLETVDFNYTDSHHTVQTSLEFQGCQVTIRERKIDEKNDGTFQSTMSNITGPFALNDLRPDEIDVGSSGRNPRMIIPSINPIPLARETRSTPSWSGDGTSDSTRSFVQIDFSTKEMAKRQAKAWHDAIVACGGKAVPDKLY